MSKKAKLLMKNDIYEIFLLINYVEMTPKETM